jgi:hypothetical protein
MNGPNSEYYRGSDMRYDVVIPVADRTAQVVALELAIQHGSDYVRVPRRVLAELLGLQIQPATGRYKDPVSLVKSVQAARVLGWPVAGTLVQSRDALNAAIASLPPGTTIAITTPAAS